MCMKEKITEEQGIHKAWYDEARKQTLETLPAFLEKLSKDYDHDYGTICHAIAAAGIGAMWAVEQSPSGGITGFQAGAIIWEVIRHWGVFDKGPLRMIEYQNMLYPQYADKFEKTIRKHVWEFLQKEAQEKLNENGALHPDVKSHLESIVSGIVPFGYTVEED